jgi:hypothetical protein
MDCGRTVRCSRRVNPCFFPRVQSHIDCEPVGNRDVLSGDNESCLPNDDPSPFLMSKICGTTFVGRMCTTHVRLEVFGTALYMFTLPRYQKWLTETSRY